MLSFRLPYPPTVNLYWRMWNGRPVLSTKGRAYRCAAEAFRPTSPLSSRLAVRLKLTMPDRRKRDIDNVAKAVLDAIGHAGIWNDDSQVDRLLIERIGIEPPGCVDVIIEEM